jgi:hypothetical protein
MLSLSTQEKANRPELPRYAYVSILWHVNPLLGNEMVDKSPRRRTLDRRSVAKLPNSETRLCNQLLVRARKTDFRACAKTSYCTSTRDVARHMLTWLLCDAPRWRHAVAAETAGLWSPLPGNASVNTVTTQQYGLLSVWSVPTAYKRSEFSVESQS